MFIPFRTRAATMTGFLAILTVNGTDPLSRTFGQQPLGPKRYVIRGTTPTCKTCVIELIRLTSVGAEEEPEVLTPGIVTVDHRARTVAYNTQDQRVVFDSTGRRIAVFGRKGRGPGEFAGTAAEMFDAGDTLYTFDPWHGRVTVYGPDYQFVRTDPFPANLVDDAVVLGGGRYVVASTATMPMGNNQREILTVPLHLVVGGKIVRSFGKDTISLQGSVGEAAENYRRLGLSTRGRVWASHTFRYVIERWDTAGAHELSIVREVDWFPVEKHGYSDPLRQRPHPSMVAVWEDSQGRVWTMSRVADAKWRERRNWKSPYTGSGSIGRLTPELEDSVYDSIVEVFDPERGLLLTSARLDKPFYAGGVGFLYSDGATPDGGNTKEIWRLRMGVARTAGKNRKGAR
jgi:hypothetical protein